MENGGPDVLSWRWMMRVVRAAMKAVPATRFALGIAGVGTVGFVLLFLAHGRAEVALGVVSAMLVLMVGLLVFAVLVDAARRGGGSPLFEWPMRLMLWAFVLLNIAAPASLFGAWACGRPCVLAGRIGPLPLSCVPPPPPEELLKVWPEPDTVGIRPGGYQLVTYHFEDPDHRTISIDSQDVQFHTLEGEEILPIQRGARILGGNVILKQGVGAFRDNVYLDPRLVDGARAKQSTGVQLTTTFVGRDERGKRVAGTAILRIHWTSG